MSRLAGVIDGVIGYTGGMNIGQEHIDGGPNFDWWRDTQVRLEGEGAAVLLTARTQSKLDEAAQELDVLAPGRVAAVGADMTDPDAVLMRQHNHGVHLR